MTGALTLGLDVGTSSVKALVLDEAGRVAEVAGAPNALLDTPGAVEADPETWWTAARAAIAGLKTDPAAIAAVGLSGNMSSVAPVDARGAALRPALLLADARGSEQLAALDPALRSEIEARSGNAPAAVFALASLLWLADAEPEVLERCAAWLSAKDVVRARLTGAPATDVTDAGNSLLCDTRAGTWDAELIERLGLPLGAFPPLLRSDEWGGRVTAEAAAATGLAVGTPVAVGAADMATAALGAGAVTPDTLAVSLGTSVTFIAPLGDAPLPPACAGRLSVHPLPAPHGTYALASLLTGGLALDWLRRVCGGAIDLPGTVDPDPADPLVFVPQLAGAGSPDFNPMLRGALLGLTPHTRPADLAGALFEAIACELASLVALLDAATIARIRVTGGGANVGAWVQTIADVLQRPVEATGTPEVSGLGAALLARRAMGLTADPDAAASGARPRRWTPRVAHADAWRARRERYAAARALAIDYAGHVPTPIPERTSP